MAKLTTTPGGRSAIDGLLLARDPPPASAFTVRQSAARGVLVADAGGLALESTAAPGHDLVLADVALAPVAGPYGVAIGFVPLLGAGATGAACGLALLEASSGKINAFGLSIDGTGALHLSKFSQTGLAGAPTVQLDARADGCVFGGLVYLRVVSNGAVRRWEHSSTGRRWRVFHQEPHGFGVTTVANRVGAFVDAAGVTAGLDVRADAIG